MYPQSVQQLITELSRLPGIGQRTAQRLAFHVLRAPDQEVVGLARALTDVRERVGMCSLCFNLSEEDLCVICSDSRRDTASICVVEEFGDIFPVERTHEFRGLYHVLGGSLSPLDGVDASDLKLKQLFQRVSDGDVKELVIATNSTTSGEATAHYIADHLRTLSPDTTVSRLASGIPVGADLEYADEVTLGRALLGRLRI